MRCLYCQWTSEELGLVAADPASLAEAVAEQERKGVLHENIVTGLVQAVKQREAEALGAARSRKSGSGRARTGSGMVAEDAAALFSGAPGSTTGPWKVTCAGYSACVIDAVLSIGYSVFDIQYYVFFVCVYFV